MDRNIVVTKSQLDFDCDANSWAQLLERIKDEP